MKKTPNKKRTLDFKGMVLKKDLEAMFMEMRRSGESYHSSGTRCVSDGQPRMRTFFHPSARIPGADKRVKRMGAALVASGSGLLTNSEEEN